ncbi:MAG: tetratricopeptide repeat protein [Candidatus Omnitrophica bacterium]|nr:tetratricopeptide repeat protein [Candidatus Omnitrophota bacterium]
MKAIKGCALWRKMMCILVLVSFLATGQNIPLSFAQANLSLPGQMVALSQAFNPPVLAGIKVYSDNPFKMDFILDKGDVLSSPADAQASTRLIKYFLASLTVPEKDLWVNLSPYEKDRIVPDAFGQTEMGRDLLALDYFLKQITSSLLYPEGETGKKFWAEVYRQAARQFGTTDIPVDTFNKVWIVPEKAVVYENAHAGTAYIVESHLKVMLDVDYYASNLLPPREEEELLTLNQKSFEPSPSRGGRRFPQIMREIIIPVLEKEVNEGKNFAQLRQVYQSLVLAAWYKKKIKDGLLSKVYADKNKIAGVNIKDPREAEKIWGQYVEAFKKGVYNFVKEEQDPLTAEMIPRKYFSGGAFFGRVDEAMSIAPRLPDHSMKNVNADIITVQLEKFLSTPVWPTPEERERFAGSPEDQVRHVHDVNRTDWLYLTDHIAVQFVPREKAFGDFLRKVDGQSDNDEPVYYFTLPEDINVRETLMWLKKLRSLRLSDGEPSSPGLAERFKQAAGYLARQRKDKSEGFAIQVIYGLGDILFKETDAYEIPAVSVIKRANGSVSEQEILAWMGIKSQELNNLNNLIQRAVALAVQNVQIKVEDLTYWRGVKMLKEGLKKGLEGPRSAWRTKFEMLMYKVMHLGRLKISKRMVDGLVDGIAAIKDEYGEKSPQAGKAQIAAIKSILGPVTSMPGWVDDTIVDSPKMARLTQEVNCLGRSALMALYLKDLGLEFWSVSTREHSFLLARLADGRYFWVEPSGWPMDSKEAVLSRTHVIPPRGERININGELGKKWIVIRPWREGILASFYNNIGIERWLRKDYDGAVVMSEKAIAIDPNDAVAYDSLGTARMKKKDYKGAVAAYKKAIATNPRDAYDFHYNLGVAYAMRGNRNAAVRELETSIALNPKYRRAHKLVRRILKGYKITQAENSADKAMNPNLMKGGVDLTLGRMNVETRGDGGAITLKLDAAMLEQLQNVAGFVPVIINVQPLGDLRMFLGARNVLLPGKAEGHG